LAKTWPLPFISSEKCCISVYTNKKSNTHFKNFKNSLELLIFYHIIPLLASLELVRQSLYYYR
jgi:hypothetical protein